MGGPLSDVRVVEFAGLGPAPFGAMMLADFGADVVRIDRPGAGTAHPAIRAGEQVLGRGKRSIVLDVKSPEGLERCIRLVESADVLIEGFRPGVMERLGLGPDVLLAINPRLVYARMTGWGQDGPLARSAGHDLNYIALTGALHAIGSSSRPVPPLNLLGDFGGGSLYLVFGIMAALHHARRTGYGQVIDCAIVDGTASLMGFIYGMSAAGEWAGERESNFLDGGAPYYGVYQCRDGHWITIACIEPQFYEELRTRLNLSDEIFGRQEDRGDWPAMRAALEEIFLQEPRDHWCRLLEGTDVCFAPVLSMSEAADHQHVAGRGIFVDAFGLKQPAPAPRLGLTAASIASPAPAPDANRHSILTDWLAEGVRAPG